MKLEEGIRLGTAIVIPIAIVWLGYLVENSLGSKERLVQERIEVYEEAGPVLNDIYVYVQRVGHYKEIKEEEAISAKRVADKLMYSNQAFFSSELFDAYEDYMSSAFETYRGEGLDARPKSPSAKHRKLYTRLMKEFNKGFN